MPTTKNERLTENIVRDSLRRLGYYDPAADLLIEEQASSIEAIKRLLRSASKSGKGGKGAPEFIISSPASPDFLLIVECKASVSDQRSAVYDNMSLLEAAAFEEETPEQQTKRIQNYAVDGALHYAQYLSKEYNVIALAVSGQTTSEAVYDTYLYPKRAFAPKKLLTKEGEPIDRLLAWTEYIAHATYDPTVQKLRFDELMAFSRELHDFMRDYAKLTESEKPLVVSGTLIALRNKVFS